MRLINMEMEDFLDDSVPPYAILSHTWGPDEVSHRDFKDLRTAQTKLAWRRIANAARLASEKGLEFLWADTCCIDKTSVAELQEAINSMYRWYAQSAVCFAILTDVVCFGTTCTVLEGTTGRKCLDRSSNKLQLDTANPSHDGSQDERGISQYMLSDGFIRGKWFTHGWTLQELTAPSTVQFFDRDYSLIGDKHELSWALSWRSRIDVSILRNETSVHAI